MYRECALRLYDYNDFFFDLYTQCLVFLTSFRPAEVQPKFQRTPALLLQKSEDQYSHLYPRVLLNSWVHYVRQIKQVSLDIPFLFRVQESNCIQNSKCMMKIPQGKVCPFEKQFPVDSFFQK